MVMIMKKIFILMIVAIILGGITGRILYSEYKDSSLVFSEEKKLYFLEEGIYYTKESLEANTKDIHPKLVLEEDKKYHVYVGITSNRTNINKIKKIYRDGEHNIKVKEVKIDHDEFRNNVEQFDILIDATTTQKDILTIEEVILSNYENLIKEK